MFLTKHRTRGNNSLNLSSNIYHGPLGSYGLINYTQLIEEPFLGCVLVNFSHFSRNTSTIPVSETRGGPDVRTYTVKSETLEAPVPATVVTPTLRPCTFRGTLEGPKPTLAPTPTVTSCNTSRVVSKALVSLLCLRQFP